LRLQAFSKLFAKHFQIFRLESPSFSKHFFVGFEPFQRVRDQKKLFSRDSKLFACRSDRRFVPKWEFPFARSPNEAKTKRNRFASEIVCFAKPLNSLGSKIARFRGFERFQRLRRFAKRFFAFSIAKPDKTLRLFLPQ
jgi:hypothetical protein